MWKYVKIALVLLLGFGLMQLIPYGRTHDNPPVVKEPAWSSPQVRGLAQRACFDCHSNETVWPWYSQIAPVSWLVQRDVDVARWTLNFSDWVELPVPEGAVGVGAQIGFVVRRGAMPPAQYLVLHPGADLSSTERSILAQGFVDMLDQAQK